MLHHVLCRMLQSVSGRRWAAIAFALCLLPSLSYGQHVPVFTRPPLAAERDDAGLAGQTLLMTALFDEVAGAATATVDPASGVRSTTSELRTGPIIPEPMLFDLMRPLGAARGELEVNALVRPSVGRPQEGLAWAPEIEWAFAPGHTVELELPFEGGHVEAFKFGVQGTLGSFRQQRSIHGWQVLVECARTGKNLQLDMVHLAGHRLGSHWSVFTMQGVRWQRTDAKPQGRVKAIFNPTVFRDVSERLVLGLETNLAVGAKVRANWVLLPQAHIEWRRYSFQMGLGAERSFANSVRPAVAFRVVRTLGAAAH